MKKPINEIKRMQRIAGLITEGEYQESLNNKNNTKEGFTLGGGGAGSGSQTMSWEDDNAYLQKFSNLKVGDKVKYTVNRAWSHDVVNEERIGQITKINPSTIVIGSYRPDGTLSNWTIPKKWIVSIKKIR